MIDIINLPHQKPIRFVKEVLSLEDNLAIVSCSFPTLPTLAMICEASAQSSAVFGKLDEKQIGFVVTLKDIELLEEAIYLDYEIKIKQEISFGLLNEFSFELINCDKIYARGNFVIKLQD